MKDGGIFMPRNKEVEDNEEMDEKFKQLNDKFALLQSQLFDKHQHEIKQFIEKR